MNKNQGRKSLTQPLISKKEMGRLLDQIAKQNKQRGKS